MELGGNGKNKIASDPFLVALSAYTQTVSVSFSDAIKRILTASGNSEILKKHI